MFTLLKEHTENSKFLQRKKNVNLMLLSSSEKGSEPIMQLLFPCYVAMLRLRIRRLAVLLFLVDLMSREPRSSRN